MFLKARDKFIENHSRGLADELYSFLFEDLQRMLLEKDKIILICEDINFENTEHYFSVLIHNVTCPEEFDKINGLVLKQYYDSVIRDRDNLQRN